MDWRTFFEVAPVEILWLIFAYALNPIPINRRMLLTTHYFATFVDRIAITYAFMDVYFSNYRCPIAKRYMAWILTTPDIIHISSPLKYSDFNGGLQGGSNIRVMLRVCVSSGKSHTVIARLCERAHSKTLEKFIPYLINYTLAKQKYEICDMLIRLPISYVLRIPMDVLRVLYPHVPTTGWIDIGGDCGFVKTTPAFFELIDKK
jgi:hypothetical protein